MDKIMSWTGILILGIMAITIVWGLWMSMKNSFPDPSKTHHDNRPGSHYYESNKKKWEA